MPQTLLLIHILLTQALHHITLMILLHHHITLMTLTLHLSMIKDLIGRAILTHHNLELQLVQCTVILVSI